MRKLVIALTAAATLATVTATAWGAARPHRHHAPAATGHHPQYGTFGFDLAGMDRSVAPGDSFYRYANGNWDRVTQIPADRSNYGMFTVLDDLSTSRTHAILEQAARHPGSRIGDLYASFMDEARANRLGIEPLRPLLAEIHGIRDRSQWAAEIGRNLRRDIRGPFSVGINSDARIPTEMIAQMRQSGLGLPDRDYYLSSDAALTRQREAYQAYLAQLLTMAGEADAAPRAAAILRFEHGIAEVQWTRVQSRDRERTYNKWTIADFGREAPGFDWTAFFRETGLSRQQHLLVAQPSAFAGTARLIGETPQAVLNDYLLVRALDAAAPYLSQNFVDAHFAFHGTILNGTPQNEPRWKRAVALVTGAIPDDLSRIYVQRYFPPATKRAADALVHNIIAAMDVRLQHLTWMAPETRERARVKLRAFTPKIGYPSFWHDYSNVRISRTDLIQNVLNAAAWQWDFDLNKLGRPVDRREWGMTPMEINAYSNSVWNEIVFPAAILQPPFFDPNADMAVNYGGIGAVIGHELSHHFDDQGSRYDEHGALHEWWTPQDRSRFNALTALLVAQYDAYEPLPGHHVQGALTLGENIADLAGLTVSYDAYHHALGNRPAPVLGGWTGDQRFFIAYAQAWQEKQREDAERQQVITNEHSPGKYRVNGVVRNVDAWYKAFNVQPGDKLYLPPEQRVHIW